MLTKVLRQRNFQLMYQAQRSVHLVEGKGYHVPHGEAIEPVIEHLDKVRPKYTLLHFVAKWNPSCAAIEKDYEHLVSNHQDYHHIKVDCDVNPKLMRYFDARVQPSFLALINGGEIARMNHFNFEKLGMQLEQIT